MNSRGEKVKEIQTALNRAGFFKSAIDGIYGRLTQAAVRDFQKDNKLTETGEVDEETYNEILEIAASRPGNKEKTPGNAKPRAQAYWLLKINDHNWEIELLKEEEGIYFHSHTNDNKKRVEYESFQKIKKGDKVFGYAYGNNNAIVCNFEVTEALHMNASYGEIIRLRITELVKPPLSISSFNDKISFTNELGSTSVKKLFPLTAKIYDEIVNMKEQPVPVLPVNNFLPFLETEGNHTETKDQLDFENDIGSLASVIAMRDVKAPLAIGLFGKWGSGKSFFMKQLKKKIIELKGYDSKTYVQNVVHVEFNSWHYSDTNLWASMVTKIFNTLDQYARGIQDDEDESEKMKRSAEKIKILNAQKAAIENQKNELSKKIEDTEGEQKNKREELAELTGFKILKLILTNKHVNKSYSELKNPHIENILNDQEKIEQYAKELDDSKNNLIALFKILKTFSWKQWSFAIGTVLFIFLLKLLAATIFKDQYESITKFISLQYAGLLAVVANFLKYTLDARKEIVKAKEQMDSLKKTFDDMPVDDAARELKKKKEKIESDLQQIETQLVQAKKEIEDVESGRTLLDFVEKRSKDATYAGQLGLISWIRKDFEDLAKLLMGQDAALIASKSNRPGAKEREVVLKVDRIILYIDDLDRCNEDLVVKVLEAIHLILAFELFVVIVGVDPRWLNNALNEKYKMLFGIPETNDTEKKKGQSPGRKANATTKNEVAQKPGNKMNASILDAATSYDYLEKIFQIPFCLKPINKSGREKLIGYLVDRGNKQEEKLTADIPNNIEPEIPPTPDRDDTQPPPDAGQPEIKTTDTGNKKEFDPPIRVNFTKEETDFMKKMSVLFGQSPRSINRYVNIYRIIKAHKGFAISGEYSFDEFAPTLFLLGVIVGHSVYASDFIDLINASKNETKFRAFLKNPRLNKELIEIIKKSADDELWDMPMINYKRNISLISRFSFRTLIDED